MTVSIDFSDFFESHFLYYSKNGFCISKIQHARSQLQWSDVLDVINYFYCCIRPEGLLYDAERDLLAVAKFIVRTCKSLTVLWLIDCRNSPVFPCLF